MPEYKAKGYLIHEGRIIKTGETVELTTEQAERLGDKVGVSAGGSASASAEDNDPKGTEEGEKPLREMTVAALRDIAQDYDIPNYSKMNKDELVQAIEARQ